MVHCSPIETVRYVSGELAPAARAAFEAHVAECPQCAGLVREQEALVARLDDWALGVGSSDLTASVLARLDATTDAGTRRVGVYGVLRVAAAVAMGVGLGHAGGRLLSSHDLAPTTTEATQPAEPPDYQLLSQPGAVGLWEAYVELESEEGGESS